MSGWKQWESENSTEIVDGADGDVFEILKYSVVDSSSLATAMTTASIATAATVLNLII